MNGVFRDQLFALINAARSPAGSIAGERFAIYGAGNFGEMTARLIENAGGKIAFFLDAKPKENFPWPVFRLEDMPPIEGVRLVLGIFNPYVELPPLVNILRDKGFRHIITPVELFYWLEAHSPAPQYWLATTNEYRKHGQEIIDTVEYLEDEISKKLYVDLWRYRFTGDIASLPPHSQAELQYFPSDVPPWTLPLRFIDCGAYTGDTINFIRSHNMPLEAIAAFEPDPANYTRLAAYFSRQFTTQEIFLAPCGVYSRSTQLRFSAQGGGGSAISENGDTTIQCISIDECLPSFRPNLIKMDIEGAEIEALLGAERTIKRHRPGLAISLYHTPHHIWQIPKLIHDWDLGYKLYVRTHLNQEFDTVLYALPEQEWRKK